MESEFEAAAYCLFCYRHTNSIKSAERTRRGSSSEYLLRGPKTKLPRDWKGFLHNSENKKQLNRLLFSEWQTDKYSKYLVDRQIFVVCEEECVLITAECGRIVTTSVQRLCSSQEEADTRIVLHCLYATQSTTEDNTVIVRSPDTDVFVFLHHYSVNLNRQVLFDTGTGNNRRLLDIQCIAAAVGGEMLKALPALHAFTGSDCVSSFVRKGKVTPFKMQQVLDILASSEGGTQQRYEQGDDDDECEVEEDCEVDNVLDIVFDDDEADDDC